MHYSKSNHCGFFVIFIVYQLSNTYLKVLLITDCQTLMQLYLTISYITIYRVHTQKHEAVIRFHVYIYLLLPSTCQVISDKSTRSADQFN